MTWAPSGFSSDKQSVGHNAAVAYTELEHWKLGCEALPSEIRHEIPIDIDEEMSRLSALAGFAPLPTLESDAASAWPQRPT